ncbi:MAG: acyltransferase [Erysipelotrichales bacterium]|nr:acyltransferase [Erysipelotrichales bacterium]
MLTIGDNAKITNGVIILTHDYSWSVGSFISKKTYGNIRRVIIGNNCFIGMNSIILRGTTIGDNVIIGAGSVVSGKIESNSVYAGNPAKKIMTLDEFISKREEKQLSEAVDFANEIKKRRGRHASEDELFEYFWLYSSTDLSPRMKRQIKHIGVEKEMLDEYYSSNRISQFKSFNDFLEFCDKQEKLRSENGKK